MNLRLIASTLPRVLLWLVGAVFIFSGLIKLNDPLGTAIKLDEYFGVFAADGLGFFAWFKPISLPLAFVVVIAEVLLGVALVLGYRLRVSMWVAAGLLVFFGILTFYSAYFNKVTDCGCFGDAIKLSPWQSFAKDVVLLAIVGIRWMLSVVLSVLSRRTQKDTAPATQPTYGVSQRRQDMLMGGIFVVCVAIGGYAVLFLPFIDFRVYKVGTHIPTLQAPSAPLRYGYEFVKDGERVVLETYTRDSSYQFVQATVLNPEDLPKIRDYALWNDAETGTEASLMGNKLLIVLHKAEQVSTERAQSIAAWVDNLPEDIEAWILTASSQDAYQQLCARAPALSALPYYYADATLLKTMVRTNPGLVLLQEGAVRGKWSPYARPTIRALQEALVP